MPRLLAPVAVLLALVVAAAILIGARGGDDDGYKVRAIFDNAGFVIPGEDVKVSGVTVGAIDAVEVTDDFKAAVVLDITEPGFQDFRRDARCIIRPQSLIGERFVECEPTQPRAVGDSAPPELAEISSGPGAGQRLLGVENTEKSVDLDLINNIYRLPYRQRLSIVLNELGAAVAGRGGDLNAVIRRANPALRELQRVLAILGEQNQVLAQLAEDGDRAIAPLARERRSVGRFVSSAADLGQATVERRAELEGSIQRLPRFLRELRPTMRRLGGFAEQATPVLADLRDIAPEVNALVRELGPFSEAALPALDTLGDAGLAGVEALDVARPVIRSTDRLAVSLRPVARQLADVLTSFERNDGIERLMDFLFYQVAAINGFDAYGHYLRAGLQVNTCSTYTTEPVSGCSANFDESASPASAAGAPLPSDPALRRTAQVLAGADPAEVLGAERRSVLRRAREGLERLADGAPAATGGGAQPAAAPTPVAEPAATPAPGVEGDDAALLDYLFGKDAR